VTILISRTPSVVEEGEDPRVLALMAQFVRPTPGYPLIIVTTDDSREDA